MFVHSFCLENNHCGRKAVLFLSQVEKESMQTTYTENECSMLRYVYDCVFFVARKPTLHFNGQEEEDLLQNSPPAAKSSRREGSNRQT